MNDPKCNDVLPFLEMITIKCLLNKIKSILVNDFEFLPFYNDELTSLSELNSRSSNIAGGYSIEIHFENLGQICKGAKDLCLMSTKSLSNLSIKSLDNNNAFDVFVNLKSIGLNLKTGFFQLSVNKDDTMKDVLHSIIQYHVDRQFLGDAIGQLLMNNEPLISIASNEKFIIGNIIYLSLNTSCLSLQACQKIYIKYNSFIKLRKKETTVKKDLVNDLMMSSKIMLIPQELSNNCFPNKLYNHIISLYRKYNLSVFKTELETLVNLTKATRNLIQVLYPKTLEKNILHASHHEIIPSDKLKDRITNQFVNQTLRMLVQCMNDGSSINQDNNGHSITFIY